MNNTPHSNIVTVVGAGAWGTAVAQLLARNGQWVCLYTHEAAVAAAINQTHSNPTYLPDVQLPPTVWATTDVRKAADAHTLFCAVPVPYVRKALQPFRGHLTREHTVVALCKGIENDTLKLPSQLIGESVGVCQLAVAAGPNFAAELVQHKPMGMVVVAERSAVADHVAALLRGSGVVVNTSNDTVGVELCSALKNVVSIAVGITEAATQSHNAAALVLTKGLQEMDALVRRRQGKRATVYGLAGIGDTVLSALGSFGRNRKLGQLLGQGKTVSEAVALFNSPPEGVNTARSVQQLCEQYQLSLPLCQAVYRILYHDSSFNTLWA
jgi:glycerol-3-phosphate dehydrogenase (NAD(P)+)